MSRPTPASAESVTDVHVIFKTHLDVGFTDLASNVIQRYVERFIPGVLSLAEQFRREGRQDRYVWTTGSWLISTYLERASPENRRRMERAIEAEDFFWHGLPFTMHSELVDPSLFWLGTRLSARLDERFGRRTIAAKMTDVPGHTRGIVPVLVRAGLRLLHVGVNPASTPPDVPALFVWKSTDGSELMVMYHKQYGGVSVLPDGRTAVSINFTGDNQGPHSLEQIAQIYAQLREQFPNARVFASNLNAVAHAVEKLRDQLPIVTQELGDTWIHGAASDPLRMAEFRELSRLRKEWLTAGKLDADSETDLAFGTRLLRIAEHTWGLDVKTHLQHWDAYDMQAFRSSRQLPAFKKIEASWQEKRAYVSEAMEALPVALAAEAREHLHGLRPVSQARGGVSSQGRSSPGSPPDVFDTRHFRIAFDPETGAICRLQHRASGREWAGPDHQLGLFAYQTYSAADFDRFQAQYLTQRPTWALADFGKPGLETSRATSGVYFPRLKRLSVGERHDGQLFVSEIEVPRDGHEWGCPRDVRLEISLPTAEPIVSIVLKWFDKPACRLPEALWLSFEPRMQANPRVEMDKMGEPVSPLDVVSDGNRNLHGVIDGVTYADADGGFRLRTWDAFLVAPGRRSLLIFDDQQPDLAKGLHLCLCNNVWGTNFSMWFEDDIQFRLAMTFF